MQCIRLSKELTDGHTGNSEPTFHPRSTSSAGSLRKSREEARHGSSPRDRSVNLIQKSMREIYWRSSLLLASGQQESGPKAGVRCFSSVSVTDREMRRAALGGQMGQLFIMQTGGARSTAVPATACNIQALCARSLVVRVARPPPRMDQNKMSSQTWGRGLLLPPLSRLTCQPHYSIQPHPTPSLFVYYLNL